MVASARKNLIKNLSWSVVLPPVRFLYAFAIAAIMSKSLTVADYGDWSLFNSNIGLLLTFSSFNLMYASSVRLTGKPEQEQKEDIFRIGLFKLGATIIIFIGFSFYLYYKAIFPLEIIELMLVALIFRSLTDMTFGFFRALLKLNKQVTLFVFESLLIVTAVAVAVLIMGTGLMGAIIAFIIGEAIAAVVGLSFLKDYVTIAPWNWGTIREYLRIGIPLIPFAFSELIVNALVPLIIKIQSNSEAVALYSIAQKVALVCSVPNAIINNIYVQYLRQALLDHGGDGVRRKLFQFLGLYLAMIVPLLVILYFFGDWLILLVSTESYLGTHDLLMLLAVVNVIIMLAAIFTTVFAVYERTRKVGILWISVLALFILLAWFVAPPYGLVGIAWSMIAAFGLGLILIAARGIRLTYSASSHHLKS